MAIDTVLGSTGTGSSLLVGGTVSGTVDVSGDQDWYRITLTAGQQYRFNLQGIAGVESPLSDPYLRLLNSAGVEIAYNDDSAGTLNSSITFTATSTTTYYLSAQGFASNIGSFSLSATNITGGVSDVPGGTSSTTAVAVGSSVTGTIGAGGDQDWYRVSLTSGHQYRFDLQGASSGQGTLSDPYLRLLNGAGTQLAFNDDTLGSLDSSITFTASTSGTYFLSAQAFDDNQSGTFRLRATDLTGSGGSDVLGNTSTGSSVAIGGSVAGTINAGSDEDWYRVTLTAGHEYRFDLRGLASGQGTLDDPVLRLLNGSGSEIAFNDDSGGSLDSRIVYTPTQNGTYFLSAQGFYDSAGTFRLSAADLSGAVADVPGTSSTTATVAVGGSRTGTIGPSSDQDWYKVTLVAGHQYRFDLHGFTSSEGTLVDPYLRLLSSNGSLIASNDDSGGTLESSIAYTAPTSGTYILSAQGYQSNTGTFRLSVTELTGGAGEVPAGAGTASAVAMGGSMSGTIDTNGDQDWYRVTLISNHQYRFDLLAADSDVGTLVDPYLRLLSSTGAQIRVDDDSGVGLESRITYTALTNGTYYLSAQAFGGYGVGTFVVSATDLTASGADVGQTTATTGRVFVGGTISGTINPTTNPDGDQDWYQVSLVAGRQYRFDLQGFDSDAGTLSDPYLRLLNASGAQLTFDDDSGNGLESRITYTPGTTGVYYLSAQAYAGYSTGTFVLGVTDLSVDVAGSSTTGSSAVLGGSVTGTINTSDDQDWFRVSLVEGHRYALDLRGSPSGQGTLADPLLRVVDATGAELALDDDSGLGFDASMLFTAPYTGTYFLAAHGYGSRTGTYALSAFDLDEPRDVLGSIGSGATITMQDSVTGTVDAGGDQDWYQVVLVAGYQYRFDLQGAATGHGSLPDPYLRLMNSGGAQITFDDDSGTGLNSSLIYTAGYTGVHFLSAGGYIDSAGSFTLSATSPTMGTGDIGGDIFTWGAIPVGGSITGTIGASGDQDWYWTFLTAGHQYRFDLLGADSDHGTLADPYLRLLNSSGALVTLDDDSGEGLDSSLVFTPGVSDYYYLSAQAFSSGTGTFVLSAVDTAADVLATLGTSAELLAGSSATGTIDVAGDQDWFRVLLLSGREYRFDLQGSSSAQGTLSDPYLRLLNGSGVQVSFDDDTGTGFDSSLTYSASQTGYYYVSAQGFGTSTGTYTLNAVDLDSPDVPASTSTDASLAPVGGVVQGTIDTAGDQDWYRVTLVFGNQYRFDLAGLASEDGELSDPYLRLLNGSGAQITFNDDANGLDSSITYTATASGAYYLSAQGYGSSVGAFTLSSTDLTGSDLPANTTTGAVVIVGGSALGTLGFAGDHDWYQISLVAGHEYRFDLLGMASGVGTLSDPYLRLLDGFGTQLDFDDDSGAGLESSITYIPGASGLYYLSAQAFAGFGTGTFVLSATDLTGGTVAQRTVTGTSGANTLTGTEFDDLLQGLGGDDRLDGKGGDDTLDGSLGNDDLGGGLGDDSVVGGEGNDTFLQLTVESAGNDTLVGGAGDDVFRDHFGRNTLTGGDGADLFVVDIAETGSTNRATGGSGQDIYQLLPRTHALVNGAFVVTDFQEGIGGDFLNVSALLDASSEGGYLTANSNTADFVRLRQLGADTLLEWNRDGPGTAFGWQTYLTLKNVEFDKVESENFRGVIDVGTKGSDALDGTLGNDLLVAAEGNDTLDGGIGMDVLLGGNGNDTYYVDDIKDVVLESAEGVQAAAFAGFVLDAELWELLLAGSGGIDTLKAALEGSIDYSLEGIDSVENLKLDGTMIEGTGNELNNVITGNSLRNRLSGLAGNDTLDGGGAADTLAGGAGNDTYLTGAGDVVSEASAQGTDLVRSSVSHVLRGNVENLTLTGLAVNGAGNTRANAITGNSAGNTLSGNGGNDTLRGGAGADVLNGNSGKDTLRGEAGADVLSGNSGNDTLTGGRGADKFDFNAALSLRNNVDRITDFNRNADLIRLDNDIFDAFGGTGTLAARAFYKAAGANAAHDASDRIIYNTTNGNLYYDEDGAGGTAAKLFAILSNSPDGIGNADLFIIG